MFEWLDIGFIRGFGTVIIFAAFIIMTLWAYSSDKVQDFENAANIPFADEKQKK